MPAQAELIMSSTHSAKDFMVSKLVTLPPGMDVLEAVGVLLKYRVSGAPVTDSAGTFLGVFSEKCAMHVILDAAYDQLPSHEVRAFMDTDPKTISPETDLLTIAQVFLLTPFRRLPVLDEDGRLLGQVSRRDVMRAAMDDIKRQSVAQPRSLLYLSALFERHDAPLA